MDSREEMTLSGSSPYYFNGGIGGPVLDSPEFKDFSNPNDSVETNVMVSHLGPTQNVENLGTHFGEEMNMVMNSGGYGGGMASGEVDLSKKKRGRPRKYGPDGANVANVALALSPLSSNLSAGSGTEVERKNRGRPKGSGRKQRLASLGNFRFIELLLV